MIFDGNPDGLDTYSFSEPNYDDQNSNQDLRNTCLSPASNSSSNYNINPITPLTPINPINSNNPPINPPINPITPITNSSSSSSKPVNHNLIPPKTKVFRYNIHYRTREIDILGRTAHIQALREMFVIRMLFTLIHHQVEKINFNDTF